MRLHDLQQQFLTAMYQENTDASPFIKASPLLSSNERLAIYRGSVRGGLLKAMSDIYPVVEKLLGEHSFEGLCRQYISRNPSKSANISDYGINFADFIENFKPLMEYPYLADIAHLEWAWHQVFNEADNTPLALDQLSLIPPEQQLLLKFSRPHASRMIKTLWPIKKIWQTNQPNSSHDNTINLIRQTNFLMVWRNGYEMRIDSLNEHEWHFLQTLENATHFSEAIEMFLISYPETDISKLFATAVSHGWIVDFNPL